MNLTKELKLLLGIKNDYLNLNQLKGVRELSLFITVTYIVLLDNFTI